MNRGESVDAVRQILPPDAPPLDIPYSMTLADSVNAYVGKGGSVIDIEVAVPGGGTKWVQIKPTVMRPNGANPKMWHFDGTYAELDARSQPQGPKGTCNGWVSTVENINAAAGKITLNPA